MKSQKDNGFYYGSTEDIETRIKKHNSGKVKSTKHRIPFVLHYIENFESRAGAVVRERFFKTIDGYNWLRQEKIIEKSGEMPEWPKGTVC